MPIKSSCIRRALACCAPALISLVFIGVTRAQGLSASEAQVKAVLVYNFAKFVEWPQAKFSGPASPVHLCVAGRGPAAHLLAELDGKGVQGRELRVQSVGAALDPAACHLLFIIAGNDISIGDILKKLKTAPVLTVSDSSGFAEAGGVIEIVQGEGRMQFDINLGAAQQANLRLSSHLLKLARNRKGELK